MKTYILPIVALGIFALSSCKSNGNGADAYGNFEATEITVSAETPGKLLLFDVDEGERLDSGKVVGLTDTLQMALQKKQLEAKRAAIATKTSSVFAQLDVLEEEYRVLQVEHARLKRLVEAEAATEQQLEQMEGRLSINRSRVKSIEVQNASVVNEVKAIDYQVEQLEDQMRRGRIINPISGTVLVKMVEQSELVNPGKPLYKIAALDHLYLRAYLSGSQLAQVKLGQQVEVRIDQGEDAFRSLNGTVTWVSEQAEFTPKIVQTKEERVNLVYAFKVRVPNDGSLKIGMPGEVIFPGNATASEVQANAQQP